MSIIPHESLKQRLSLASATLQPQRHWAALPVEICEKLARRAGLVQPAPPGKLMNLRWRAAWISAIWRRASDLVRTCFFGANLQTWAVAVEAIAPTYLCDF